MDLTEIGPSLSQHRLISDSRRRTLAKTIVYRLVAIALLAAITYYYTGSAGEATVVTILFNATGAIAYYGLERLWEAVSWGRGSFEQTAGHGAPEPVGPNHITIPVEASPRPVDTEAETNPR